MFLCIFFNYFGEGKACYRLDRIGNLSLVYVFFECEYYDAKECGFLYFVVLINL